MQQVVSACVATTAAWVLQTTHSHYGRPHASAAETGRASTLRRAQQPVAVIARTPISAARPLITPAAEAEMMSRMGVAVACGAMIGLERRAASANAGVRTLSLVSLGSAIFSLTALHGLSGDPVRMGAAISTGIGFLGSGAINGEIGGSQRQLVTAASIWIAAALGVAAASGMFRLALTGSIVTVWILRWELFRRWARVFIRRRVYSFMKRVVGDQRDSSSDWRQAPPQ